MSIRAVQTGHPFFAEDQRFESPLHRYAVFLTNASMAAGAKDPAFVLCLASLASRGGTAPRLRMVGAASRLA